MLGDNLTNLVIEIQSSFKDIFNSFLFFPYATVNLLCERQRMGQKYKLAIVLPFFEGDCNK